MSQAFQKIDALPRAALGPVPTPLEAMANLGRQHGGKTLYVKRDDCTALAFGGNKVRQLEFYLGEALAEGADTILITGAVQSNFVRLAAAASAKLGLACHIQLEQRVPKDDPTYNTSGNVLLDRLLGATLHSYDQGEDEVGADRRLREIAEGLRQEGRKPYVIPLAPGHKPLGALGYAIAARELLEQIEPAGPKIDEIVVPSGSGNTHAGFLFGLRALGCQIPVTGICVRRAADQQFGRIRNRVREIAELLAVEPVVSDADILLRDDDLQPGYGRLNDATIAAIQEAARCEGLILDPVYTGKTMAGFLKCVEEAPAHHTMLFLHTGGQPALFAYLTEFSSILA